MTSRDRIGDTEAWFPKSPRTCREAVLGISLALAEPLLDPRVLSRCMRMMDATRDGRPSLWLAMWSMLLRGVGLAHQYSDSPLLHPSLAICGATIGDTPDDAETGAWWPDGEPFGDRGDWGAPAGADDTDLNYAAPDAWCEPSVVAVALSAVHGLDEVMYALEHVADNAVPLHALRHLAWSARQLGAHDSRTMYALGRAVATSSWGTVEDAEAGLRLAVAEATRDTPD